MYVCMYVYLKVNYIHIKQQTGSCITRIDARVASVGEQKLEGKCYCTTKISHLHLFPLLQVAKLI